MNSVAVLCWFTKKFPTEQFMPLGFNIFQVSSSPLSCVLFHITPTNWRSAHLSFCTSERVCIHVVAKDRTVCAFLAYLFGLAINNDKRGKENTSRVHTIYGALRLKFCLTKIPFGELFEIILYISRIITRSNFFVTGGI